MEHATKTLVNLRSSSPQNAVYNAISEKRIDYNVNSVNRIRLNTFFQIHYNTPYTRLRSEKRPEAGIKILFEKIGSLMDGFLHYTEEDFNKDKIFVDQLVHETELDFALISKIMSAIDVFTTSDQYHLTEYKGFLEEIADYPQSHRKLQKAVQAGVNLCYEIHKNIFAKFCDDLSPKNLQITQYQITLIEKIKAFAAQINNPQSIYNSIVEDFDPLLKQFDAILQALTHPDSTIINFNKLIEDLSRARTSTLQNLLNRSQKTKLGPKGDSFYNLARSFIQGNESIRSQKKELLIQGHNNTEKDIASLKMIAESFRAGFKPILKQTSEEELQDIKTFILCLLDYKLHEPKDALAQNNHPNAIQDRAILEIMDYFAKPPTAPFKKLKRGHILLEKIVPFCLADTKINLDALKNHIIDQFSKPFASSGLYHSSPETKYFRDSCDTFDAKIQAYRNKKRPIDSVSESRI